MNKIPGAQIQCIQAKGRVVFAALHKKGEYKQRDLARAFAHDENKFIKVHFSISIDVHSFEDVSNVFSRQRVSERRNALCNVT